jgi:ABC-type phosphate/phosphonate transport system ATPase subunit
MTLAESRGGIQAEEMVSFIGAGGKTTMLFHLAKELHQKGGRDATKEKERFNHKGHKGYKLWDGYSRPFRMI